MKGICYAFKSKGQFSTDRRKFLHVVAEAPRVDNELEAKNREMGPVRDGHCSYGDACRFSHVLSSAHKLSNYGHNEAVTKVAARDSVDIIREMISIYGGQSVAAECFSEVGD